MKLELTVNQKTIETTNKIIKSMLRLAKDSEAQKKYLNVTSKDVNNAIIFMNGFEKELSKNLEAE